MKPRPDPFSKSKKNTGGRIIQKSSTFLAILIVNFAIMILLGTLVVYHFQRPPAEPMMLFTKVKTAPPPPRPPSKGGESQKSQAEVTVQVVPPPLNLPSVVTSMNSTSAAKFTMSAPTLSVSSLPTLTVPVGTGLSVGGSAGEVAHANSFGESLSAAGTPALVGYFYDLKQTNDDPPAPSNITQQGWKDEMLKLVANNLDENVLKDYFKSPEPRSSNGFSLPEQESENAPKAFGLEGKVQPNLWCIVYHAKAFAPEAGHYRFVGFADDIMVIKKDGQIVLDGGCQSMTDRDDLHQDYPNEFSKLMPGCRLRKGTWFNVEKGDLLKLDVAIGDWGGLCGFFLFLEKEGDTYDTVPDGTPKLPLFQLGAKLPVPSGDETPPASDSDQVWTPFNDSL